MPNFDSIQPPDSQEPRAKVSLLTKTSSAKRPRSKLKRVLGLFVLIIIILGTVVVSRAMNLSDKIFVGRKLTFFQKIVQVLQGTTGQTSLVGENVGQVNVLLLGIGGEGHDGPFLTDTMILAQIRLAEKKDGGDLFVSDVVLTSVPRDYWVNIKGFGDAKLNEAFSDGFLKKRDWAEGGELAMDTIGKISGLDISYFAVIDFSGFEKAVNQIGGLDIKVERGFTDYTFPNDATAGYLPPQTFQAGWQHMDGKTALIFARSRHADSDEGSDFARSARQQLVLQAFKEKVFNLNLITDAGKINDLLGTFADHFHTNISPGEMFRMFSLSKAGSLNRFLSLSLDPETGLICPRILASTGAYVLTPCPDKSEDDVKSFFKNAFSIGKLGEEKSVVWLADSTGNKMAYDTAFRRLTNAGLIVYQLSYTKDNLPQTLVYQANAKPATAEFIRNELSATEVTLPPPGVNLNTDRVDVIVVLGKNAPAEPAPRLYIPPPARVSTSTPTSTPAAAASTKPSTTTKSTGTNKR